MWLLFRLVMVIDDGSSHFSGTIAQRLVVVEEWFESERVNMPHSHTLRDRE